MITKQAIERLKDFKAREKRRALPDDFNVYVEHQYNIDALDMAIEALEKQIPLPMNEELDITDRPIKVCGNCGDTVTGFGDYCNWCGQRIER